MALLLAQARNIAQADRDLHAGEWNRARWEGVELHDKTLGIVGLGRVGVLVAQRARAFGMRLVGRRPLRERRPRPPARRRARADARGARAPSPTSSPSHLPKTPENVGLINGRAAARTPSRPCGSSTRRAAGIVDEDALAEAIARRSRRGCRARRVRRGADRRESPLFELDSGRRHAAPRRVDERGAGQGRPDHRRAGRARAARRVRAVRRQPRGRRRRTRRVQPFMPLAERLGRLFTALAGGVVDTLEISYEGEIADYDCRVLTLVGAQGRARPGASTSRCRS